MVVADELEADWRASKSCRRRATRRATATRTPTARAACAITFEPLRRMAAAVRQMLEQEAAARWNVAVAEVKAAEPRASCMPRAAGASTSARLRQGAAARPVPARETPWSSRRRTASATSARTTALVDNLDFTTGKAQYGIDARLDGMAYAVVARPPVFGGKVKSFDAAETMKVPGVLKVVPIDAPPTPPVVFQPLGGIAVVAENTFAAIKGRVAPENPVGRRAERAATTRSSSARPWKRPRPSPARSCATMATSTRRWPARQARIDASYYIPHLAHATDGAAFGHRARDRRGLRDLVPARRTPRPSAAISPSASTCRSTRSS